MYVIVGLLVAIKVLINSSFIEGFYKIGIRLLVYRVVNNSK